jgi:glyoxylase-like metal-dependent hydrolase (beta-lactamase superfamily II)
MLRESLSPLLAGAGLFLGLSLLPAMAKDFPFPDIAGAFPPLPPTAVGPAIPPNPGYIVQNIRGNVFWTTDGNYQAMFIVTRNGVVLVDAPDPLPFFPPLPVLNAIKSVTGMPVTHLIYSHAHTDHIAGAGLVKEAFPNVEIVAQEETKRILEAENDPRRPIPTETFKNEKVLNIGGELIELRYFGNTHIEGNAFIYLPKEKILMVVDIVFPGWVPFRRLALSTNVSGWASGYDDVLKFDFDTLVGGHLTRLGTRHDVEVGKEYVEDIKKFIEEVYLDANALFSAVGALDNQQGMRGFAFATVAKWALFAGFFDFSAKHCSDQLDAKWFGVLGGAETFDFQNCEAWFVARRLGTELIPSQFPEDDH